jgi:hypothetical protein
VNPFFVNVILILFPADTNINLGRDTRERGPQAIPREAEIVNSDKFA